MIKISNSYTVEELIEQGIIEKPLDGNHGGSHPKGNDFISSGIPFVMASDINNGKVDLKNCKFISIETADNLRKGFSRQGDVLLTHKASIGRTAIVPKIDTAYIMLTPQVTYYRVIDANRLNNNYLKYYFDSRGFQNELKARAGSGSTRAYIGITDQKMLTIKILPIKQQKAIASILSALDDKIELNLQINKTLEEMAMTLYKHWFVDFGPFQDGKFVDSELGMIPEGWAVKYVKELGKVVTGGTPSKRNPCYFGEFRPFITPTGFKKDGLTIFRSERGISEKGYDKFLKKIVPVNSVIVTCIGSDMGKVAINKSECLTNQQINSLVCNNFIFMYFFFVKNYNYLKMLAGDGTTMPIINKTDFENIKVLYPNKNVLTDFEKRTEQLLNQIHNNSLENQVLTKLRDTLLPKLISGEIRLKEFQKNIEQVL